MYRNAIDFCIFILHSTILLNSFITGLLFQNLLQWQSILVCTWILRDSIILFLLLQSGPLFICLLNIALARVSCIVSNGSCESKHLHLDPCIRGIAAIFFTVMYGASYGLYTDVYQVKEILIFLVRYLYHKEYQISPNAFYLFLRVSSFCLYSINMMHFRNLYFKIKPILHF